jgi:uncharacterized protein YyaL (SSP411 family)
MTNRNVVSNRLINEKSPYLLQHAQNPVNWFPWGDEAFNKAKAENKPVFLSIGYSTCHWCHVMGKESFEDKGTAEILNKYFISIKVDREERPDIDNIYMTFCQAYAGNGGWPLTVILTPDRSPFFAGTYFPRESRYGMPGLKDILHSIHEEWTKNKEKLIKSSHDMVEEIKNHTKISHKGELDLQIIEDTVENLKMYFQKDYGGFSKAPKFPTPHNLYFLLRYYFIKKDKEVLNIIEQTLQAMYKGGIFDHVGYGFSRYSTDEKWLAPHFEKMLYDNALLSLVYTETYKLTGNSLYKDIAKKIFTYILRDMRDEEGALYSAEDADSEGEEGKFYLWSLEEITNVLGYEKAKLYTHNYDITEHGNFEEQNIPNLINTSLQSIEENKELREELKSLRNKLYEHREKREHPFKDDKILTSWNGLMIASLAYAGRAFEKEEYVDAAKKAAEFILKKLIREDGRLLARYRQGEAANLGILDDYAFFIWALIELYQSCFEIKYIKEALILKDHMIKLFWDKEEGGFYLYGSDNENLIMKPKELYDGAIPSGNSVAALDLLRLSKITGDLKLEEFARNQFQTFANIVEKNSTAYTCFIAAFMYYSNSTKEIVIAGEKQEEFVKEALKEINKEYNPFLILILNDESESLININTFIKGQGKVNGKPSIYICENFSCKKPITNLEEFKMNLKTR